MSSERHEGRGGRVRAGAGDFAGLAGMLAAAAVLGGCDEVDNRAGYCYRTTCENGSGACCPFGTPGVWDPSFGRCTCAAADADADEAPDADGEADDEGSASCGAIPVDCTDSNDCTTDTCDPEYGCIHTPIAGCCRNDPDCDDLEPCTVDRCDGSTGNCTNAPVAAGEPCRADAEPCTEEVCNGRGRCGHPPSPDFTPCGVVTSPDRSYDICIDGVCESPGCGEARCNVPGPNWPLPDTNQRTCYDAEEAIPCPGEPGSATCGATAFCGQDAQYGWDTTHLAEGRFLRIGTETPEPLVRDTITGLEWTGCLADRTGGICAGSTHPYVWEDALAFCDGLEWAGSTDWHLPSAEELVSVADYGASAAPAIDTGMFGPMPSGGDGVLWSSSSVARRPVDAWSLRIWSRGALGGSAKINPLLVLCVRGGTALGGPRFVRTEPIEGEPIVADGATTLIWQGCPVGLSGSACSVGTAQHVRLRDAMAVCESSDWGGFEDWYLPNIREAASIVDRRRPAPALDPDVFPGPWDRQLSSSTVVDRSPDLHQVVELDGGVVEDSRYGWSSVRCVRAGRGP